MSDDDSRDGAIGSAVRHNGRDIEDCDSAARHNRRRPDPSSSRNAQGWVGYDESDGAHLRVSTTQRADRAGKRDGRSDVKSVELRYRDEDSDILHRAPDTAGPRFFMFMRNSIGAGDVRGARERWIAPGALYKGSAGIGESSWTITPETVIALRLHGAVVEDHNRRATRTSGPGRNFALQPRGTPTRYLADRSIAFGQVFLTDALLDRASEAETLPALSGRLRDDLSFVPEKTLHVLTSDYLRRAFDGLIPTTSLEMEARALLLADWLLRLHQPPFAGEASQAGGLSSRHLRRTCDFIVAHLAEDICLDDLAELSGLSAKHFARAFKQSTGLPPHQYLIVQRIEAAKRSLIDTKASLADIALACGFADQSHFTATFRKIVGAPPGIWRLIHAK